MTDARCGTCRFWRVQSVTHYRDETMRWGLCLRMPPAISRGRASETRPPERYPESNEIEWCGEWQATQEEE